jgi:predicted ester cyclase
MATYKERTIHLTVLSIGVGAMLIASFALYAHPDFANAQSNNKTSILPPGVQSTQGVQNTTATMTVEQARAIVAPLYEALNEPTKKDVPALLANATNPDYTSCSTNSDCLSRDQLAGVFTALGKIIPDLHWTIKDIWTSGNRIVVRGEATGTPTGELYGAKPTGKSFKTISIDMFTVRDGKLATAYHVENWMAATEQIK